MYLRTWDGKDNRSQILSLLEYLPVDSYDNLRAEFLDPLEAAILDHTVSSKAAVLDFYSRLIRRWGVILRVQPSIPTSGEPTPLSRLITHAELLSLSTLEHSTAIPYDDIKQSGPITLSVLQLYSTLSGVFSHAPTNGNIRLTIPIAPTVYVLAFTPAIAHISLLSSTLGSYKSAFEASLTSQTLQSPKPTESLYPPTLVGQFNGFVMDVCNLLWRNRGLNADDPNALGCLIPASTVKALTEYVHDLNEAMKDRRREDIFHYNLPAMFSLSHHGALGNASAACFADIENERNVEEGQPRMSKPVTQKALSALEKDGGVKVSWQEYRLKMLDWLDEAGIQGIGKLMRTTMKALRKD